MGGLRGWLGGPRGASPRQVALVIGAAMLVTPAVAEARQGPPGAGPGGDGAEDALTTVIIVRHAERAPGDDDPHLSEAGAERARTLAWMLQGAGVTAVYSTAYNRTRETVEPLARRLGLETRIENPGPAGDVRDEPWADFARRVVREHRGGVVLIAGHSNTVAPLVTGFGAGAIEELTELEYDHLFVVTVSDVGNGRLLRLRFGEANPPPAR